MTAMSPGLPRGATRKWRETPGKHKDGIMSFRTISGSFRHSATRDIALRD